MSRSFDDKEFRRACGQFLTGITIVTTRGENGVPLGVTANSFTSVSIDPPLVLVCLGKKLGSYDAFRRGHAYAVHVLREDQADLSTRFATRGADKFGDLEWREGLAGVPILPDYLALFECRIVQAFDGGDHTIFVGQVEHLEVGDSQQLPLGFFRGKYVELELGVLASPPLDDVVALWALGWA